MFWTNNNTFGMCIYIVEFGIIIFVTMNTPCITNKTIIVFSHNNDNNGDVIFLSENIETILEDNNIVKLVYNDARKCNFRALNWSYSKGDTFDNVCVILTNNFEKIFNDDFSCRGISQQTINQLYVALTRTKGNLYIIKNSDYKDKTRNSL